MNTLSVSAPNPDVTKRISNYNYYVSSLGVSSDFIPKPLKLRHTAAFNVIAPDIHNGLPLTRTRDTILNSLQNLFKRPH